MVSDNQERRPHIIQLKVVDRPEDDKTLPIGGQVLAFMYVQRLGGVSHRHQSFIVWLGQGCFNDGSACVSINHKILLPARNLEYQRVHQRLFKVLEGGGMFRCPIKHGSLMSKHPY